MWGGLYHEAAEDGDIVGVRKYLALEGAEPMWQRVNGNGKTALHYAVIGEHTEVVKAILAHPATDPNVKDHEHAGHRGALHLAARSGYMDGVIEILAHPATRGNIKGRSGVTPLHGAAYFGHVEAVLALLARPDVDPNSKHFDCEGGDTALHAAARSEKPGATEAVAALLAHPAIDSEITDVLGHTAFDCAQKHGNQTVMSLLMHHRDMKASPGGAPPQANGDVQTAVDAVAALTLSVADKVAAAEAVRQTWEQLQQQQVSIPAQACHSSGHGHGHAPPPPANPDTVFHTLGGASTDKITDASHDDSPSAACVFAPVNLAGVDCDAAATVDDSRPSTCVQVKTAAGKKIRIKVNQDVGVLQLAAVIARESAIVGNFTLSHGYPPRVLTNTDCSGGSIADVGLAGAAITQNNV